MMDIFAYEFMQNALLAALLVSIAAGIIGSLIVVNRMVFLTGGIAHASYGGIGLAVYFGLPLFAGATLFSVLAALLIAYMTINERERTDTFIGLIWAVGMAIGIILVDLTPGYNVDLMSYLFGSLLAVSQADLYYMYALVALIIFIVTFWYRDILAVSYDTQYAKLRGIHVNFFYTLILVLAALCIVIAIKAVGLILVIALLSIPTYIAEQVSVSLQGMMLYAVCFASFFSITGLIFSYSFDLTSGASIILVASISFILFLSYKKFFA
ncbi:MAG: metal ABC transporter permease [Sulfurospirillum sp.]|nr:metal ABC transporter permease [Sulfurospirillum sp.]